MSIINESNQVLDIYTGKVGEQYEKLSTKFFADWKRKAIEESSLKKGDRVLVFCCGTGLDFPHILEKIGSEGYILGVDFSEIMLDQARNNIDKNSWNNVEVIGADITKYRLYNDIKFDAGVCTLGMSVIPKAMSAYENLLSNIRSDGEIIISDMQLAKGWKSVFNPLTVYISKKYGGTYKRHKNSTDISLAMIQNLKDVKKETFLLDSYFYCLGKKN
jgi:demethylmenaquinone methyltransferase/2-methoxy-6-polyprenyl-1,4-benzoquinol methylase